MVGIVLRRAGADELPALGEAAGARPDRREAACRAAVAVAGERLGTGSGLSALQPVRSIRPETGAACGSRTGPA